MIRWFWYHAEICGHGSIRSYRIDTTGSVTDTDRIRCRVYVTVERPACPPVCPSVCLSHRSTKQRRAPGLLLSALRADVDRQLRLAAGVMLQAPPLSSKCGQRHVDNRQRRLNIDLLNMLYVIPRVKLQSLSVSSLLKSLRL